MCLGKKFLKEGDIQCGYKWFKMESNVMEYFAFRKAENNTKCIILFVLVTT